MVDPEVFTNPIAVASDLRLAADTELLEYVCAQTPKGRFPLAGTTAEERAPRVPPQLLARYTGEYEIEGPAAGFGVRRLTVTRRLDSQLFMNFDGKGNVPLVPVSETMFSPRLQGTYEFITDGHASATHVLIQSVEGTFKAVRRPDGPGTMIDPWRRPLASDLQLACNRDDQDRKEFFDRNRTSIRSLVTIWGW